MEQPLQYSAIRQRRLRINIVEEPSAAAAPQSLPREQHRFSAQVLKAVDIPQFLKQSMCEDTVHTL